MILTRMQILKLDEAIKTIERLTNKEFSKYFLISIYDIESAISETVKNIEKAFEPSNDFKEFEFKRDDIIRKCAEVNPDGTYKIIGNKVEIQAGKLEAFKAENIQLYETNKEILKIRQKELQQYKDILNTTVEIVINKIDFSVVPDFISDTILRCLLPVIKRKEES